MIIDFHTHIFPDKVAEKAVPKLAAVINHNPSMNGTAAGLLDSMEKSGVDISVILPVVTNPHQIDSVIRFAAEINETYGDSSYTALFPLQGFTLYATIIRKF